ncbi:ankyrin repeat domain-containing protein [Roseibium aggregatum]|uniref:Ankyrin repeat domain-containing protein n=1 Tax=Roseibium aggregatum TaxID=187304 RepID=A0A939ECA5_9HYPH|nr:ankyrin repeat domain-containing protein [Roseibium aggregatum]MBN9669250.1 ankyrin repeat domain-containing protein [Roseibium aggregatum]
MSDGKSSTLERFKRSARVLKKAYAEGEAQALARVAAHTLPDKSLKHADFLHVIACEAGQDSWPKLKFALETTAMNRRERAERLKIALFHGQHWVTEKLLAGEPDLKDDDFGLQIALLDLSAVHAVLAADPSAAVRTIGVRSPILHLAYSREVHRSPEKAEDMMAIAALLVANGADVDDGYAQRPGEGKLSALYGALCHADNYELGRWLLERGANPNDNESLYHSTELEHSRALRLLLDFGAIPDGTNALPRALDFESEEKVRLLLSAGASPNVTEPDLPGGMPMNSIPSLHHAIRRGRSARIVDLLLEFGAEAKAVWCGHTAYATALIYGNGPAARFLGERGYASPLSDTESVLAGCAESPAQTGRLDPAHLTKADRCLLTELAATPGRLEHLEALVRSGFDPDMTDHMGLSPLQIAGWNGLVPEMAYFLSLGPDLTRKNGYGGDALDTVVHGAEFAPKRPEADHIACARLLLEAGSVLYPAYIAGCGNEDMAAFLEDWRDTRR